MNRAALLLAALLAVPAFADTPDFGKGGVIIQLEYGYGFWNLDRGRLENQVGAGEADVFISDAQNGNSATLNLGYNILGHVDVLASLTGTGWDLFEQTRGGGGFITGVAAWHPLQLFLGDKPRFYDLSVFGGAGYGIVGERRGMDGFCWQWGVDGDVYLAKSIAVSVFYRSTQLNFGNWYIDYNNRRDPGNTVSLPQGSGGSFGQVGVGLTLRVAP